MVLNTSKFMFVHDGQSTIQFYCSWKNIVNTTVMCQAIHHITYSYSVSSKSAELLSRCQGGPFTMSISRGCQGGSGACM